MSNRIKAYLSHMIRGPEGNNASDETMRKNNLDAQAIGNLISSCFQGDLYIPADMDDYLLDRGRKPLDYVDLLLNLDCRLVIKSDILLVYSPDGCISGGMQLEIDTAKEHGIPVLIFDIVSDDFGDRIKKTIQNHVPWLEPY